MLDLLNSCSTCCDPTERLFPILQRFKWSKLGFFAFKGWTCALLIIWTNQIFFCEIQACFIIKLPSKTILNCSLLNHPCIYASRIYMTLYTWSPKCASSVQCGHCDPRCDQTGGRVLTLSNPNLPRGTHSVATVGYTGATICPLSASTLTRVWCAAGLNRVTLLK